jgi:glycosyltransferase involved in cell wall biosynthesis
MDRADERVESMISVLAGPRESSLAQACSSVAHRTYGELLPAGRSLMMFGTSPEMRGGIAAVVASLRAGGLFERIHTDYVVTHVEGSAGTKLAQYFRALRDAWRLLRAGRVGLVHAHVSSNGSFWRKSILLALARRFGVPTVFHLHSGGFGEFAARGWGGPLLRWWIRRTLEASTVVVVLSQRWAQWTYEFAPRSRIEVVGNPALTPESMPDAAGRDSANGPGRVLYLGMVSKPKGCYDLLHAWVTFRRRAPGWRLSVGGNGEVGQFLAEAERLGIRGDIDFLGWVSGADKDRELRRADIFVLPSYAEGMPVSVLEAMAYGVAVVTTPVGGVPDMMQPDEHGLWIRPGDVDGLAQRLADLARSAELRSRLAAAAREQVMCHNSVPVVISRLLQVYRRALAGEGTY